MRQDITNTKRTAIVTGGSSGIGRAFVAWVSSAFPDIKLLVNNAGGMRELDFTQADLLSQDLTQEIRANLDGVINMTAGLCCLAKT